MFALVDERSRHFLKEINFEPLVSGDDFLDERIRAEDILLGSLGFTEDARIVTIELTPDGYRGRGRFSDGESFDFESDEEIDELQEWALQVLTKSQAA